MLGLGDIVVPGLYISFLVKFGSQQSTNSYLYAGLFAYSLGLLASMGVSIIFESAQPDLLFTSLCIVPALLLATYINAK